MHQIELLAPAGDLNKLKTAIECGADAVYIGGEIFGLKSSAKEFTKEDMLEGIKFAHERNRKVYVNVNLIPHNDDFRELENYLLELQECNVDAVIIGDPGVLDVVKRVVPDMEIHLNEQANITNYVTANFWYNHGVKRVIVTKELSIEEIAQMRAKTPLDMDIEALVHGEICISYSGRRLISNFMTGKEIEQDSVTENNKIKYHLVEEKRPDEYYPVYEDKGGTFLFNSSDLCMIEHIDKLIKSGLTTLKIEGKLKDEKYLSTVVKAYREAIDEFYKNPTDYKINPNWIEELKKNTNREYTTGFYLQ